MINIKKTHVFLYDRVNDHCNMENNSRERVFLTVIETLASRICGGTLFEEDKILHVPHHHTDIYKYHMSRDFRDNLFFALNTITFTSQNIHSADIISGIVFL